MRAAPDTACSLYVGHRGNPPVPRIDNGDLTRGAVSEACRALSAKSLMTTSASFWQMLKGSFTHRGSPELETTLRRMVVVFRFLGWISMVLLVIVTLISNPPPRLYEDRYINRPRR